MVCIKRLTLWEDGSICTPVSQFMFYFVLISAKVSTDISAQCHSSVSFSPTYFLFLNRQRTSINHLWLISNAAMNAPITLLINRSFTAQENLLTQTQDNLLTDERHFQYRCKQLDRLCAWTRQKQTAKKIKSHKPFIEKITNSFIWITVLIHPSRRHWT